MAFTISLSIIGMWMLRGIFLQQWIAWIIVDAVCACLYWYKGIHLYGILYAIYTIIAFFGYRKWLRLMPDGSGSDHEEEKAKEQNT